MHGHRSLHFKGVKTVKKVVGNVIATTHSYTIMPMSFADGHLHPKLLIVLQERDGKLPANYYKPENLVVKAHSSHIMTGGNSFSF